MRKTTIGRVLMIAPTPFFSHRGTHIRILEEARALEARGYRVTIATYHIGDNIDDYITTEIDVRRIRRWLFWYKKTTAGYNWQKIILNLFLIRKTWRLMRELQPEIVHGHNHEGVVIAWIMRKCFFWRRFTIVADFHGSLVREMRSHGYLRWTGASWLFKRLERWINQMGDVAVVSSKENIPIIAEARVDGMVHHVYDGVDLAAYAQVRLSREALRDKYGIPQGAFVVVYTGAMIVDKGFQHIAAAARRIRASVPDAYFIFGGYPTEWITAYIAKHDMKAYAQVISPLNYFALPEVNALGDVGVDPKDDATLQASGKILQYMAAELAVVCLDRPTNQKYVGSAGVYVTEVTEDALAEAVIALSRDRAKVVVLGKKAQEHVQVFSWTKVGERLAELYEAKY